VVSRWWVDRKGTNANSVMKMPPAESFLRSIKRRSLRVKRSRSLGIEEKRKSGELYVELARFLAELIAIQSSFIDRRCGGT
jgi:hypothetical protein